MAPEPDRPRGRLALLYSLPQVLSWPILAFSDFICKVVDSTSHYYAFGSYFDVGLALFTVLIWSVFFLGTAAIIAPAFHRLIHGLPPVLGAFILTPVVAAIGIGLYGVRTRALSVYAYLEMGFAFAVCFMSSLKAAHAEPGKDDVWGAYLGLLAGAYLIVRGLDNQAKAREQLKNDEHDAMR